MGCGGLMAKYPGECDVVTVADSGPVREAEHAEAMRILGIGGQVNLGFQDGEVTQHMSALVGAIDQVMAASRPEELYLPYPSLHQDHIAVYEAGMRSCRVSMSLDHWYPPSVFVYDIAVYDVNLVPDRPALERLRGAQRGADRQEGAGLPGLPVGDPDRGAPDQQRPSDRRSGRSGPAGAVRRAVRVGAADPPVRALP